MNTYHPGVSSPSTIHQRLSRAEPRAGLATLVFWKNLFELNPALRPLLPEDTAAQDRMLTRLLSAEACSMANFHPPVGRPEDGNAPADRATTASVVGEALLWTLQEAYGADFTPQARSAWESLYRFVTDTTKPAPPKIGVPKPEPSLVPA